MSTVPSVRPVPAPVASIRRPFLGLYLKLLLVMVPVTVLLFLGLWLWQRSAEQAYLDADRQQVEGTLATQLSARLAARRQEAALLLEGWVERSGNDPVVLAAILAQQWPALQRSRNWQGLVLRQHQEVLVALGDSALWPQGQDGSHLVCRQRCMQLLTLSVDKDTRLGLLLPLAPLLEGLHQELGLELLLLRPGGGDRVWGMGIAESATTPGFAPMLSALGQERPTDDQRQLGQWLLWWQPLAHMPVGGLLVAKDVRALQAGYRQQRALLLWFGIPLVLVVCVLLAWWVWQLVQRLALHRQQLGWLAEEPQKVQPPQANWFRDELDQLGEDTFKLSGHLQHINSQLQSQVELLEYRLRFDELTGLANRHYLEEKIALLLEYAEGETLAVVFVDIQQFKAINDSLGYDKGDLLLKEVANRLKEVAGACHGLGRFSGDKFVVLMRYREKERLQLLLQQLHWHLEPPVIKAGMHCQIAAVLGVALAKDEVLSAPELLRRADLALHHAKEKGLSQSFFNDAMQNRLQSRLELERDLDQALKLQQFELYLQPKYWLADGTAAGFEALIRWHHPLRGLVMPQAFIPQLENTDRIIELGYWVIEEALSMLSRARARDGKECRLAVNLACRQFLDASLPTFVEAALKRHSINPAMLELEVTESSLVDHFQHALTSLHSLKRLGVDIAIDDFGTGYSSLSYLHKLPFDVVKVDKSFTQELGKDGATEHIVKSLITLVHELGGKVVAEGIETDQQLQWLQLMGCDMGQGLLLGPPMSEEELIRRQDGSLLEWPRIRHKKSPGTPG
ncbi:putative bifunctional diguanylate cyclase/phosphodiesterase [Gallaecimonas pentaromativorans]|uniref:Diguanylate cyclase (GGDEF)-like protein n=1 Tax=Gallaecimonas pentaromativorans TaxID=584787 RepID=A0A3N1Q1J0_9GAMM|nr:bifunctional diguanylate cyclase/phosphodiesterase [Gallaecimonas pentaromativorans]ROQ30706.1 diguanylate cyclase (GGDEF)-like protein [Gallaecimonas pentaromativorans]